MVVFMIRLLRTIRKSVWCYNKPLPCPIACSWYIWSQFRYKVHIIHEYWCYYCCWGFFIFLEPKRLCPKVFRSMNVTEITVHFCGNFTGHPRKGPVMKNVNISVSTISCCTVVGYYRQLSAHITPLYWTFILVQNYSLMIMYKCTLSNILRQWLLICVQSLKNQQITPKRGYDDSLRFAVL